ncbi:MAG: hypothetical protein NXI31_09400 [bacterium]|nr:hypothetical protein [bacterium]
MNRFLVISMISMFAILALTAPLAAQGGKPAPVAPAKLPADWGERDLEGKWVAFRAATGNADGDARKKQAWALALAQADEVELLEWIALYEGWRQAGPQLARLDPPVLLRAAAWNLAALDSHNLDNAEKVMRERGAIAVAWFEANSVAQRGKGAAIYRELKNAFEPSDASRYLPPHDAMQVLVPWLDAPGKLADFGDRLTAEPRTRYAHQVRRALDGVAVFGHADRSIVRKVLRLCRHADESIARAAFRALSKLQPERVPHAGLIELANDDDYPVALREIATTTLSYALHPAAFFEVHAIAGQRGHPGREAAMRRLGEIGDRTTSAQLQGFLVAGDLGLENVKAQALRKIEERIKKLGFVAANQMRGVLFRVAWLRANADPRASSHGKAAIELLRSQNQKNQVGQVLDLVLAMPLEHGPFRRAENARIRAELARFAAEVKKALKL